jgi:hypothetical protein
MHEIPMAKRPGGGLVIGGREVGSPPCNDADCVACDPVRERMREAAVAYINRRARHARRRQLMRR